MRAFKRLGILRAISQLWRETHGISAVEFALLVPVMITLFVGGTEITQGITIKRKTTIAVRSIGDLVAQTSTEITDSDLDAIFAATSAVLAPYPAANLKIVISNVEIDANNAAKVVWSDAHNGGTARTPGAPVTLPQGLNAFPQTSLIWAEAEYEYTPTIGYVISGSIDLKDKVYLRPRLTKCIHRKSGGQSTKCSWES